MRPFRKFFSGSIAEQAAAVGRIAAFSEALAPRAPAADVPDGGPADEAPDAETCEELFTLYCDRQPLSLVVQWLDPETRAPGLSERDVRKAVEKALRGAGLYSKGPAAAELFVLVCVHEAAFNVLMELRKTLYDPGTDTSGPATTWRSVSIQSHRDDADAILTELREIVDGFAEKYLRVNDKHLG